MSLAPHWYNLYHIVIIVNYSSFLCLSLNLSVSQPSIFVYINIYIYIYIYIYINKKTSLFHNISECFDSFVRLIENLKVYNYMRLPNKNC